MSDPGISPEAVPSLVADVPTMHDTTLYLLLGDWFAWLALATLAFALVQLYRLCKNPHT
jgi:apolipoprotein N-acyltransferase